MLWLMAILPSLAKPLEPVRVLHQEPPVGPEILKYLGRYDHTCTVKFHINREGVPSAVSVDDHCPDMLRMPTLEAARKWRFEAPVVKGEPRRSRVTAPIRFRSSPEATSYSGDDEVSLVMRVWGVPLTLTGEKPEPTGLDDEDTNEFEPAIIKRRARPNVPSGMSRIAARCETTMIIDKSGKVVSAETTGCPDAMAAACTKAALRSRFKPLKESEQTEHMWVTRWK